MAQSNFDPIHISERSPQSLMEDLVEGAPGAFYLCDLADIVRKHETWTNLLPRVEPHYAVKCNSVPAVLETLAALGMGFDCASREEIAQILALGVDPGRIIFANPTKLPSHVAYAASVGVNAMTFDCEEELYKVKGIFPAAKMVLRIKCDDPDAHYQLGKKFGCDSETEAAALLELARDLGIDVVGVCFHVGSYTKNPSVFRKAIKASAKVFEIAEDLGFDFNLLDIGGGFLGETGASIAPTARVINKALDDFFSGRPVRVISEPGRYYVTSAFSLATNIHSMKTVACQFNYYVDVGVFNGFIVVLFKEKLWPRPLTRSEGAEVYPSTVWGPTCDSSDKIVDDAMLPAMKPGDWIVFDNMGAYTLSISSTFNGFSSPEVHVVADERTRCLLNGIAKNRLVFVDKPNSYANV